MLIVNMLDYMALGSHANSEAVAAIDLYKFNLGVHFLFLINTKYKTLHSYRNSYKLREIYYFYIHICT